MVIALQPRLHFPLPLPPSLSFPFFPLSIHRPNVEKGSVGGNDRRLQESCPPLSSSSPPPPPSIVFATFSVPHTHTSIAVVSLVLCTPAPFLIHSLFGFVVACAHESPADTERQTGRLGHPYLPPSPPGVAAFVTSNGSSQPYRAHARTSFLPSQSILIQKITYTSFPPSSRHQTQTYTHARPQAQTCIMT